MSSVKLQLRRGTAVAWADANPTLRSGEPGYETDTGLLKIGDGATAWNALDYFEPGGGSIPAPASTFHGARAYATTSQTIGGAWAAVFFASETYDTDAIHSTSSLTSRFTVPAGLAGIWRFEGTISYAPDGTGSRFACTLKNGVDRANVVALPTVTTGQRMRVQLNSLHQLAAGDYLELQGYSTSGSLEVGDTTNVGAPGETWAALTYLGALP